MGTPIQMDDLGVPLFLETPIPTIPKNLPILKPPTPTFTKPDVCLTGKMQQELMHRIRLCLDDQHPIHEP